MPVSAPSTVHRLANSRAEVQVDAQGAYLKKWAVRGHDGLYSDPAKPRRATHPCGPNFSALSLREPRDGRYVIGKLEDGRVKGFEGGLPQHGFLRDVSWRVVEERPDRLSLEFANTPQTINRELINKYPFLFRYRIDYVLLPNGDLTVKLSFTNLVRNRIAPVDLASHTYHPFTEGVRIPSLLGLSCRDEATLETRFLRTLVDPRIKERESLDLAFLVEGQREFKIMYPDRRVITMTTGDSQSETEVDVRQVVVWKKPEEGAFICLEPVARGRNSFNDGSAIQVVPGETVSLTFTLAMSLPLVA